MTVEEQLVQYLREISFSDLPEEAIEASRREILWTLGSCIAGARAAGSERIAAFAQQSGGRPEATIIGFGDRVPAVMAGLANGAFAKALEYEDKLWLGNNAGAYSIGTAVVPAAVAVAEYIGGVDGKSLLLAVTLATDVHGRLVRTIPKSIYTGWNSSYMFSTFGATMAAGLLLGLTQEEFMNAMGLAYAQAAGNYQSNEEEGILGVRLQMGFGVRNGITAAQLAKLGVTGAKHFLTGRHGLYPLFYKGEEIEIAWLTKDLGLQFSGTQLAFKAYPCCALLHGALDAILSILGEAAPPPESIESIQVYATPRVRRVAEPRELRQNPTNQADALFSMPWALACAAIDHKISLSHFTDKAVKDRRYLELARKVEVDMDPNREGISVELRLKDGRSLRSRTVLKAKGHPDNRQSTEEMADRYWDCVQYGSLSRKRASLAKDLVLRLEQISDVAEVIDLLH